MILKMESISNESFNKFIERNHLSYDDLSSIESLKDITNIYVNNFILWYDMIFPKIKVLLSEYIIEKKEDENCYHFWVKNVYIVYFIYIQLQKNNHINFSFREGEDSMKQKFVSLQRKYVHIINNVMLQLFTNYKVNPTRKVNKKAWNNGYQSDEYDEVTGTWDNKSYETGPCHITWTMYYISLFLKNKHKYNKTMYSISFSENDIFVKKI